MQKTMLLFACVIISGAFGFEPLCGVRFSEKLISPRDFIYLSRKSKKEISKPRGINKMQLCQLVIEVERSMQATLADEGAMPDFDKEAFFNAVAQMRYGMKYKEVAFVRDCIEIIATIKQLAQLVVHSEASENYVVRCRTIIQKFKERCGCWTLLGITSFDDFFADMKGREDVALADDEAAMILLGLVLFKNDIPAIKMS